MATLLMVTSSMHRGHARVQVQIKYSLQPPGFPDKIFTMLHHASLPVSDLQASCKLYDAALAALGYRRVLTAETAIGYGIEDDKDILLLILNPEAQAASQGFHLAFAADSQSAVDKFYQVALEHGAKSNGEPGLRAHYGPTYYAAFVFDLDGHRLEAVHK